MVDQDTVASRLKLFEAVVTPTVLFGLSCCPLTKQQVESIDALQRRMLRSIVEWRRVPDEHWSETMRMMRGRVDHALHLLLVPPRLLCGEAARLWTASWQFLQRLLCVEMSDATCRQASLPGPPNFSSMAPCFLATFLNLCPRIRGLATELGMSLQEGFVDQGEAETLANELQYKGVKYSAGAVSFTDSAREVFVNSPWVVDRRASLI